MSLLPITIPRATEIQQLYEDPLGFLVRARSRLGDIFVMRDAGPIFSRAPDCTGVIAVFGSAYHRAVLSDIDSFGMPVSAAQLLSLPENLINLNCGLHSMRGEQHSQHQRLLMRVLNERTIQEYHGTVSTGLETFAQGWRFGQKIGLLREMRQLASQVATPLLFGDQYMESSHLSSLLQAYFQVRREATSPFGSASDTWREEMIALGTSLDEVLRQYIRQCRQKSRVSSNGVLTRLANLKAESGRPLSEDELVAHANVLFISSTEPIAVALTWILLLLSQMPNLRRATRLELSKTLLADTGPPSYQLARLPLLDSVIHEGLRLLPPNALMVRITTRPVSLCGVTLPERCEIVLCPFLAHRDSERFPRPNEFFPSRWNGTRPSPFEYFPFGAGGHSCAGSHLAMYIIKAALALLMQRFEIVLADDQEIDWRIHIMFMPRNDPIMTVRAPGVSTKEGKLLGPIGDLISLHDYEA